MGNDPLTIKSLEISNIKAVRHFRLVGRPGVTEIAGDNGVGKTTILSVPRWLMEGKKALGKMPITQGKQHGAARMDLGEYVITLQLTEGKPPRWEIRSADGGKYPLKTTKGFLSAWTFDPLAFANMPAKDQERTFREFAGEEWCAELDRLQDEMEAAVAKRTGAFHDKKALGNPEVPVEEVEPVDTAALADELRQIEDWNDSQDQVDAQRVELFAAAEQAEREAERKVETATREAELSEAQAEELAETARLEVGDLERKIQNLQAKLKGAERRHEQSVDNLAAVRMRLQGEVHAAREAATEELREARDAAAAAPRGAERRDPAPVLEQLDQAGEAQLRYVEYEQALQAVERANLAAQRHKAADSKVKSLKGQVEKHYQGADLPVEGIELRADGIWVDGLPFTELARSRQIQVSLEVGMALNPRLRCVFVDDAEALGDTLYREIEATAVERGYQVLMATVGKGHTDDAIMIEVQEPDDDDDELSPVDVAGDHGVIEVPE